MNVIFDIDGTLADATHRLHLIHGEEVDWQEFHRQSANDKPIPQVMDLYRMASKPFNNIHIITARMGRPETVEITEKWLKKHDIAYHTLSFRKVNDFRHDYVVKAEIAAKRGLTAENTDFVVEDRASVCQMWRKNGFFVYQVANGDF
jgi:phosphoglycolate phosphatase-like HAD superfamily hydrolase